MILIVDDPKKLICPNCRENLPEYYESLTFLDEEEAQFKCPKCEKDFKVIINRPIELTYEWDE